MTPEQKELRKQAFAALLDDSDAPVLWADDIEDRNPLWRFDPLPHGAWFNDHILIRLAPPAEIPYHNPEGVTQEQLEPEKGWRFLTVEEIDGRFADSNLIQLWNSYREDWVEHAVSGFTGADSSATYRTKEPLPAKYQHLVPESEEARARREQESSAKSKLHYFPLLSGHGEWEFMGAGPYDNSRKGKWAAIYREGDDSWAVQGIDGAITKDWLFYAFSPKLPTEKEKAEAALNAYKLEPGERLVHRGQRWSNEGQHCNYLYRSTGGTIFRQNKTVPEAQDGYYAEIIKEPEMVPFTQETFPLGAWVRQKADPNIFRGVHMVDSERVIIGYHGTATYAELFTYWEICTDGTTWTRAGKGVGA